MIHSFGAHGGHRDLVADSAEQALATDQSELRVLQPGAPTPSARAGEGGWGGICVLVTGGTGFIGSHLVRRLLREGSRVSVLARDPARLGRIEELRGEVSIVRGDLGSTLWSEAVAHEPQVIFHLAAAGVEHPTEDWAGAIEANVRGTASLLQWCSQPPIAAGLRAFVYASTPFEYGGSVGPRSEDDLLHAPNFYAASKAAGWLFCQAFAHRHGVPIIGVRPFSAYGPRQGTQRFVPSAILAALEGRDIEMTGGEQKRDFVFIDDVIDGLLRAAQHSDKAGHSRSPDGEMFNLGSGEGVTLRHAVTRIVHLTRSPSRILLGCLPYRQGELWDLHADVRKSRLVLSWEARTSLDQGLSRTIAWYREKHLPRAEPLPTRGS